METGTPRTKPLALSFIWLCAALAFGFTNAHGATPTQADSICHPERLRCEYLVNPLGIDVLHPRFDWILVAPPRAPRNLTQTAWQIIVASSRDKLAKNQGDLWDSGKVTSDQTTQIAYAGAPLTSREICFWKVRSWDSLGKSTAWSPPASWEMGLLNPEDWHAKWIQALPPAGFAGEYAPIPLLRTELSLSSAPIVKARLYVTALGLYEMHLNGHRVGDHIFAPDWTDYYKRVRYQAYDVTSLVKSGTNALGGYLGNGWYSGHIGNGGFQAWGKVPALLAQLEVTHADGTVEQTVTDANWKTHPSPITSSDFMLGENYDAQQEIPNWDKPGLDVTKWSEAAEMVSPNIPLNAQVDQPVLQVGALHPKAMTEPSPANILMTWRRTWSASSVFALMRPQAPR
jgi:alpha-L-rhamnosidase